MQTRPGLVLPGTVTAVTRPHLCQCHERVHPFERDEELHAIFGFHQPELPSYSQVFEKIAKLPEPVITGSLTGLPGIRQSRKRPENIAIHQALEMSFGTL